MKYSIDSFNIIARCKKKIKSFLSISAKKFAPRVPKKILKKMKKGVDKQTGL